jgi:hypothetical protein
MREKPFAQPNTKAGAQDDEGNNSCPSPYVGVSNCFLCENVEPRAKYSDSPPSFHLISALGRRVMRANDHRDYNK